MATVTDDFNRANGPVADPWGAYGAEAAPAIASNQLSGWGATYQMPLSTNDVDFTITTPNNIASSTIYLQWGGSRSKYNESGFGGYYAFNDNGGVVQIFRKVVGSGATQLGSVSGKGNPGTGAVWRFTRAGGVITLYKNAVVMLTATDPSPLNIGGYAGFFSDAMSTAWDNFNATYTSPGPSLVATPNPATGAVELTVTGGTGAISVKRYVAGASPTGVLVRGSFANGRMVPDYDAPLGVDLVYIATDSVGQSPQATARLDVAGAILSVMSQPTLSMTVTVLADDNQTYEGRSTAHPVLGTNAPLVTVEAPAYRAGTYRFLLPTVDDWLQLRAITMTGAVMLLRSPCPSEFLDTAFIMTGGHNTLPWNAAAPRHRIFELDYQATAPDSTPATDIAWTWADVEAAYPTWSDVVLDQPTWADLVQTVP